MVNHGHHLLGDGHLDLVLASELEDRPCALDSFARLLHLFGGFGERQTSSQTGPEGSIA